MTQFRNLQQFTLEELPVTAAWQQPWQASDTTRLHLQ